jgi:hypothetical protein
MTYYAGNENVPPEEEGSYVHDGGEVSSYQHGSSNDFNQTESFENVKSEPNEDDQGEYYDGEEEDFEEDDGGDVKRKTSDASDESNYSSLLGPPKKASLASLRLLVISSF